MINIDRHFTMIISELNDYAKKLRLDNILVMRRKDDDGKDIIYVSRRVYAGQEPIAPALGYPVESTGEVTPYDIERTRDRVKTFLDGATYTLGLNYFLTEDGPNNFEKYRRLAQGFATIFRGAEIDDIPRVNEFLWKHLTFVFIIEQTINQMCSKIQRKINFKLGIVESYTLDVGPNPSFINLHAVLMSAAEEDALNDFVETFWKPEAAEYKMELQLSYTKKWEDNNLIHFIG